MLLKIYYMQLTFRLSLAREMLEYVEEDAMTGKTVFGSRIGAVVRALPPCDSGSTPACVICGLGLLVLSLDTSFCGLFAVY